MALVNLALGKSGVEGVKAVENFRGTLEPETFLSGDLGDGTSWSKVTAEDRQVASLQHISVNKCQML